MAFEQPFVSTAFPAEAPLLRLWLGAGQALKRGAEALLGMDFPDVYPIAGITSGLMSEKGRTALSGSRLCLEKARSLAGSPSPTGGSEKSCSLWGPRLTPAVAPSSGGPCGKSAPCKELRGATPPPQRSSAAQSHSGQSWPLGQGGGGATDTHALQLLQYLPCPPPPLQRSSPTVPLLGNVSRKMGAALGLRCLEAGGHFDCGEVMGHLKALPTPPLLPTRILEGGAPSTEAEAPAVLGEACGARRCPEEAPIHSHADTRPLPGRLSARPARVPAPFIRKLQTRF